MMSALRVVRSLTKVAGTVGNYSTKICQRQARMVECARCYSISATIDPEDPRTVPEKEWKKRLTPEQYAVAREKTTEPPYTGLYVNNYEKGMYVCICCGENLFTSETKYDSESGWPSFFESYGTKDGDEKYSNILRRHDNSGGMIRTEVICKTCDSHLGHVFDDGPPPTGKRFCVNSMSLLFKPEKS